GGYDSEDDPIVKEYDIYMTSELASSLYLFQYPVRAANKPYTKAQHSCPVDARLKSKAGLIEIDVPVNTAQNFDQEKGKIWGDALHQQVKAKEGGIAGKAAMGSKTGGKRRKVKDESDSEEETDTMLMDFQEALKKGRVFNKQTLGSKIQSDEARYMVGVFRDDQLHLTPLHHTLQLRPHFHHVDAQTSAEKNLSRSLREEDEPQKPVAAKAVHMTVNQETTQMTSTMKALRAEEEEIWKKLHWIDQEDGEAWDQYELLCLNDTESADKLRCSTTKAEYMDWLSGAK
ncbi:DNA-directed RNA polymerase III subunit Rpc5, partial [Pyronema omphalodes]